MYRQEYEKETNTHIADVHLDNMIFEGPDKSVTTVVGIRLEVQL